MKKNVRMALEETVNWIVQKIRRVKIHGQISFISIRLHIRRRQILESNIKMTIQVVVNVLCQYLHLEFVYGQVADCRGQGKKHFLLSNVRNFWNKRVNTSLYRRICSI